MNPRYTPWWLPVSVVVLLATCILLFVALVTRQSASANVIHSGVATDDQVFNWRLVTTWPKNFPGMGVAPENFAQLLKAMSNGRLNITVYGANELVPAMGVFDAVSSGSAELGHGAAYYWKGKIPWSSFFTAVPFGMNAQEFNAWIHYGGGLELWRETYAPFNLIPFSGGNTGVQMGGWFNRPVDSVADLHGLKMRIPGFGGEVFTRAGGTAVNIPGGELYTALQTGVIDATEWVGPYNDLAFGLHQIAQYYYYPGWQESGAGLEFIVNKNAFARLPADLQTMVEVAARAINQDLLDEYTARSHDALQELVNKHGVDVRRFPDDVLAEFKRISFAMYDEMAAADPSFARVYHSYKEFLNNARGYHEITEQAYYETR